MRGAQLHDVSHEGQSESKRYEHSFVSCGLCVDDNIQSWARGNEVGPSGALGPSPATNERLAQTKHISARGSQRGSGSLIVILRPAHDRIDECTYRYTNYDIINAYDSSSANE